MMLSVVCVCVTCPNAVSSLRLSSPLRDVLALTIHSGGQNRVFMKTNSELEYFRVIPWKPVMSVTPFYRPGGHRVDL